VAIEAKNGGTSFGIAVFLLTLRDTEFAVVTKRSSLDLQIP
jgi:hypothetical protein